MIHFKVIIFFIFFIVSSVRAVDQDLSIKLKKDLEFDVERRNSFKKHNQSKKVYEVEREKSLALYLEEQEKWDINREKGLKSQRASRLNAKVMDEFSPEFKQDQKEKNKYDLDLKNSGKKQSETKKQIGQLFESQVAVNEIDELEIYNQRPRFDLRYRGQNKWTKKSAGSNTGGSSGSSGSAWGGSSGSSDMSGSSTPFDYPTSGGGDYIPSDNFDDLPPPPPLVPYDGYGNGQNLAPPYYNENGSDFNPGLSSPPGYPTPPPEGGWDF